MGGLVLNIQASYDKGSLVSGDWTMGSLIEDNASLIYTDERRFKTCITKWNYCPCVVVQVGSGRGTCIAFLSLPSPGFLDIAVPVGGGVLINGK